MYNPPMPKHLLLPVVAAVLVTGCAPRDIQRDLEIVDIRTGYYDMGVTETGENKIVPSISLRLRNVSDEEIGGVQLNAVFREVGDPDVLGEHFVPAVSSDQPLAAGATTGDIVLRSKTGFTSPESRLQMLQHSLFVDRQVTILGRHGRSGWIRLDERQIERQLLTE